VENIRDALVGIRQVALADLEIPLDRLERCKGAGNGQGHLLTRALADLNGFMTGVFLLAA